MSNKKKKKTEINNGNPLFMIDIDSDGNYIH